MGGLTIFHKHYSVRRFGEQIVTHGVPHTPFSDFNVTLNVQPVQHQVTANPEGERRHRTLKSYGDFIFTTADQTASGRADWLYYKDAWYACVSSSTYDHTLLHHTKSEWVEVGETIESHYLAPPKGGCHEHHGSTKNNLRNP